MWSGIFLDDYVQVAALDGNNPDATPLGLYQFYPSEPGVFQDRLCSGPIPWWTYPGIRENFCRPLSSALEMMDHTLFDHHYFWWHLHSLLWYLLLLLTWGRILQRTLPAKAAAVALMVFTLSETHWFPTIWLANRNALVAGVLALMGLLAHLRWREDNWGPGLILSLAGFSAGLAAGETALGVVGIWWPMNGSAHRAVCPRPLPIPTGCAARPMSSLNMSNG